MTVEIQIVLDGDAEYLRRHRLSLAELGVPLQLLMRAARVAATSVLRNKAVAGARGPLAESAKRLDLQIESIGKGSLALKLECIHELAAGENAELQGMSLAEQAAIRLMSDIEAESSGRETNHAARRFLRALPSNVKSQRYVATSDGRVLKEATVTTLALAAPHNPAPRILVHTGQIAGVELEADGEVVSIRIDPSTKKHFDGSAVLVERALALRGQQVKATVVINEPMRGSDGATYTRNRLIRLDPVDADVAGTAESRWAYISKKWANTFAELAK